MKIKRVQVGDAVLVMGRPCRCRDRKTLGLMRGGWWLGVRQEFIRKIGLWEFWRWVGGEPYRSGAIFWTESPEAAKRFFLPRHGPEREPCLYRLVHLEGWHVLGLRCRCGSATEQEPYGWRCVRGHTEDV